MLTILLGTDWIANRDMILSMVAGDVSAEQGGRILMVPELISHDMERRLCAAAGDTASRFAEVLSFTRLYRRVADSVGHGVEECLDNGGRVAAMASAARHLHGRLKAYAAVETQPEFLESLVDAVDEFKRCCISAKDLMDASRLTEGALAQKLEELSLLLETYDSLCQQGKRDPSDQMTWLLEQLETSDFAHEHVFYIDGFPDFTRQHMAILEHLILNCSNITISLNSDGIASVNPAFEKAGHTASELYRFAHTAGVEMQVKTVQPRKDALSGVRDKLFHGSIRRDETLKDILHIYRTQSLHDECTVAAERIMDLVQSGVRYRDISVVVSDIGVYQNAVNMMFQRCKIPTYQSGTEDILEKSVISTVLSAVDAALGGFERRDMVRYFKSVLSPLDLAMCDRLENYSIIWNINGNRWLTDWTNHPSGLGERWTDTDSKLLAELNAARSLIVEPLARLRDGFRAAVSVEQQVKTLYAFLEDIQLSKRLDRLSKQVLESGYHRDAQILDQLWEILLSALEQLYDLLGQTSWSAETFTRLLRLLLSQYDVGTIPPVLDAVMVGPVSAMRCQESRHLIVLGALEGSLPGYSGSAGVLSDHERVALRHIGVPLTGGAMDGVQAEFAEIYGVFCGALESISVSCPPGQPSFLYRRLQELAGEEERIVTLGAARADKLEASAFLARWDGNEIAGELDLDEEYNFVERSRRHTLGKIDSENIRKLYGEKLKLSASQVDKQADCRLSYFLRYGLSAKERKTATVDPAEFGTYVHAILEKTAKTVMDRGGFHKVSLKETLELAADYSAEYAKERFAELDSERLRYLFRRNQQELEMVVQELWEEMQSSSFVPVGFEVNFSSHGEMSAIPIPGKRMDAELRGFVDRVDVWHENDRNYFRVVDYKTGKKDFDYCDVFNGYGLQLLLYLFALEDAGANIVGERSIPAGVQYFPARAPLISADGHMTDEEALDARLKAWKRKGLLLFDEDVLSAMEPGDKPVRLCCSKKKDGTISGDLADRRQFQLLKAYVFMLLGRIVDDIASGCVDPNPYTRGTSHNACAYCPFGAVCNKAEVEGRRNYKAMTAQRFWAEVEKEMVEHG